ncbi:glycosyltransferase family protein [Streptomyces sp. cmx-4-7]|uniref:glycosyltransferase family protein n=1 Tax=Streptomyces sp. cmx-4-7 TaxID=2790939 RepID=UPI003980AB67
MRLTALTGATRGLELLPQGVEIVPLPSFRSADRPGGAQVEPSTGENLAVFQRRRSDTARDFMVRSAPDALLVDHLPWGWRDELAAAIESTPRTKKILTLRGVLFDAPTTRDEYVAGGRAEWITTHYDAICVHNDPDVFKLESEYAFPPSLTKKLSYSGYLAAPPAHSRVEARQLLGLPRTSRVAVITMGGGQGAADIWHAALKAVGPLEFDTVHCVLGPYLEPEVRDHILATGNRVPGFEAVDFSVDLPLWLRSADLVVSAAGAGGLGEILATGGNAVVIPRQLREAEQRIHARRLEELGLVRMVDLEDIGSDRLRTQIEAAMAEPLLRRQPRLLFDGATATARRVLETLGVDAGP